MSPLLHDADYPNGLGLGRGKGPLSLDCVPPRVLRSVEGEELSSKVC